MRGRNHKRRETGKHGRRLLLAGLLVASGQFATAETPVAMVPLPLTPLTPLESGPAGVRSNPFCQPVVVEAASGNNWRQTGASNDRGVVQTSGGELQRRDQPVTGSDGLRSYVQSPMIEAAAGVRANPLATQFKATDPVEPKVDIQGVRALKSAAEKPSGVSFSLSDEDSSDDSVIDSSVGQPIELGFSDASPMSVDEETATKRPITRATTPWLANGAGRAPAGLPKPINLRALEPLKLAKGRILQVPSPAPTEPVADEPVVELKPLDVLPLSPDESRLVNGGRPRVEVGRPPVAVDRLATMSIIPGKPRVLTVDKDETEKDDAIQTSRDQDVEMLDAPVQTVATEPPKANAAKSLQSVLVPSEQPTSGQVPSLPASGLPTKVAMTESGTASPQPTQAQSDTVVKEVEETVLATFNLKPTEVRAIKIDSPVTHVQSDNLAVCAAIKSATGHIQLIATGVGTTRLSVQTIGTDGVEKIDRYEVAVGEVRASTVDSLESVAMTLTHTVQSAFPGSNVLVSAEAGRLIVMGSCSDEDSARRMLRMIRSACATPVVDRVKVR